jgi:hypothetical protein
MIALAVALVGLMAALAALGVGLARWVKAVQR